MAGHQNTKKHKAQHGGYIKRPGKKEIAALCGMYAACFGGTVISKNRKQPRAGEQLSLF